MSVRISMLEIEGAPLEKQQNPLPFFRDLKNREVRSDGTLLPDELEGYGDETYTQILPYSVQDRYTREKRPMTLKTIVLENGLLRATFLADYGGRLFSLVDLTTGRELLFRNPVFQPAHLAIRNAWFSGGIEWNVAKFGHTFTTCEPLFFAKLCDDEGNEFLRMYEFERQKRLFWQVDFHLPKGSPFLQAHVKIINDNDAPSPMYWWTNIAVRETPKTRVFAPSKTILYQNKEKMFEAVEAIGQTLSGGALAKVPSFFGHGQLPYLHSQQYGNLMDFDVSYPFQYNSSNEYYFKIPKETPSPWEAAVYEDGLMFFERSTQPLSYRKLFCWGSHRGGRKWCDYLALPGQGDYVELQGGLAPTQTHGYTMAANSQLQFTQLFGGAVAADPAPFYQEWDHSMDHVAATVERLLPEKEVLAIDRRLAALADRPVQEMLHMGSGWGALELLRRRLKGGKPGPASMAFPQSTLGEAQGAWMLLLEEGRLPELACHALPLSWMVDPHWQPLLEAAAAHHPNAATLIHMGNLLYEQARYSEAVERWKRALALMPHPLAHRNLAFAAKQAGRLDEALAAMKKAVLLGGQIDKAFPEEYLQMLVEAGRFSEAWSVFCSLPQGMQADERIQILAGQAAVELEENDFLATVINREFASIREGETSITDMWFQVQAQQLAKERNQPYTPQLLDEVTRTMTPPEAIDMRMFTLV